MSPNRVSLPRFHVRIGLHIVLFEVCSAFTRVAACTLARSPYVVTAIRRLQTLRLLHVCSGRFRLERSPGGACTHWKSAALSRRTWIPDIRGLTPNAGWWPVAACLLPGVESAEADIDPDQRPAASDPCHPIGSANTAKADASRIARDGKLGQKADIRRCLPELAVRIR